MLIIIIYLMLKILPSTLNNLLTQCLEVENEITHVSGKVCRVKRNWLAFELSYLYDVRKHRLHQ